MANRILTWSKRHSLTAYFILAYARNQGCHALSGLNEAANHACTRSPIRAKFNSYFRVDVLFRGGGFPRLSLVGR